MQDRRQTMKSFTWEPKHGDELSACPYCTHWHVLFEVEDLTDIAPGFTNVTIREWHEADCYIWNETDT
jgi:hypothetical protein